jgi:nucleoside-diphosphate-sugar epimerase
MKKVIVTGANGFVGSNLLKELVKNGHEVLALDKEGCNSNIPDTVRFLPLDLDNMGDLINFIEEKEYDSFYHFAWAGSAGESRANTSLQLKNVQWTIDALRTAKNLGCDRFICAGSIMEVETIAATFTQGNKPGLGYIYGSGKLVAHTMAKSVAADIGINLIWAEITNAYGEGELSPRFVNTTIRKIINNEPLQFTAATQNYDFVHISDVARAFYLIGMYGQPFCEYIIGSSNARPLKEFIMELRDSLAPDNELQFGDVPFTGIDLPLSDFDCSKTENDTGFKAEVTFFDGVRRTMDWIKQQGV